VFLVLVLKIEKCFYIFINTILDGIFQLPILGNGGDQIRPHPLSNFLTKSGRELKFACG